MSAQLLDKQAQAMVRLMPEGEVGLPKVADQLHLLVRTLPRRLEARQSSWRELLDRTREQLAGHYLLDPSRVPLIAPIAAGPAQHQCGRGATSDCDFK